jgi:Acyl-CoA reductase (LuxC)
VEFLAPKSDSGSWQGKISDLAKIRPFQPFEGIVIDFVDTISRRILADPSTRAWPELVVAAHWMRRAHLTELQTAFCAQQGVQLARGLVVHYAPSNVDSIFLYSWFISLLAGNSNVVRVSRRRGEQLEYLISRSNEVFNMLEFKDLRQRNLLVTYEHDDAVNEEICSRCSVRVIWGGDHTVSTLRRIPLPPLATELAFADRFSLAALRAGAVCDCSEEQLQHLAKNFYNDAFSFDQLACSSPRLIVWTGSRENIAEAKQKFWGGVCSYTKMRQISYPAIVTMNRVTAAYAYAATSQAGSIASNCVTEMPLRVQLRESANDYRTLHCGGGLFLERDLSALEDLADSLTSKDQTLSYYGYDGAELNRLAIQLPARAIDRIVPIGKALEFAPIWDGVDMFRSFTRCVDIQ